MTYQKTPVKSSDSYGHTIKPVYLLKLKQDQINILNMPINPNEIEAVIKSPPTTKKA